METVQRFLSRSDVAARSCAGTVRRCSVCGAPSTVEVVAPYRVAPEMDVYMFFCASHNPDR